MVYWHQLRAVETVPYIERKGTLTKEEKFARYWQQQKAGYLHFVSELLHNGILDIEEIQQVIESYEQTLLAENDGNTKEPLPVG